MAGFAAVAGPNTASRSLARESSISNRTVKAVKMSAFRCKLGSEAAFDTRSSA